MALLVERTKSVGMTKKPIPLHSNLDGTSSSCQSAPMKQFLLIGGLFVASPAIPAAAQSAYDRGYNAGYNDQFPVSGLVDPTTDYGRGFNTGQDDADDDDERHQRTLEWFGRPDQQRP